MSCYPSAAPSVKHNLLCSPYLAAGIRRGGDKGSIGSSALLETIDALLPVLDGSTGAQLAPSNAETLTTIYTYPGAPKEPICRELLLTSFLSQELFCRIVGENGGGVMRKCVIAVKLPVAIAGDEKRRLNSLDFGKLMQLLRANDLVAVLGCDGVGRIAFVTPSARQCNDGASLPYESDFVGSLHYAFQKDFVQLAMKARQEVPAMRPPAPLSVQPQLPRAEDGEVEEGELAFDTNLPLLRPITALETMELHGRLMAKLRPVKELQSDNELKSKVDTAPVTPIITMVQECCSLGEIRGKACALLKNPSQVLQALECIEVCLVDLSPPILPMRTGTDAADGAALSSATASDDELLGVGDGAALEGSTARDDVLLCAADGAALSSATARDGVLLCAGEDDLPNGATPRLDGMLGVGEDAVLDCTAGSSMDIVAAAPIAASEAISVLTSGSSSDENEHYAPLICAAVSASSSSISSAGASSRPLEPSKGAAHQQVKRKRTATVKAPPFESGSFVWLPERFPDTPAYIVYDYNDGTYAVQMVGGDVIHGVKHNELVLGSPRSIDPTPPMCTTSMLPSAANFGLSGIDPLTPDTLHRLPEIQEKMMNAYRELMKVSYFMGSTFFGENDDELKDSIERLLLLKPFGGPFFEILGLCGTPYGVYLSCHGNKCSCTKSEFEGCLSVMAVDIISSGFRGIAQFDTRTGSWTDVTLRNSRPATRCPVKPKPRERWSCPAIYDLEAWHMAAMVNIGRAYCELIGVLHIAMPMMGVTKNGHLVLDLLDPVSDTSLVTSQTYHLQFLASGLAGIAADQIKLLSSEVEGFLARNGVVQERTIQMAVEEESPALKQFYWPHLLDAVAARYAADNNVSLEIARVAVQYEWGQKRWNTRCANEAEKLGLTGPGAAEKAGRRIMEHARSFINEETRAKQSEAAKGRDMDHVRSFKQKEEGEKTRASKGQMESQANRDRYAREWNGNLELLRVYKANNGDCRVSVASDEQRAKELAKLTGWSQELAKWVVSQRMRRKGDCSAGRKLTDEQVASLDELGFDWVVGKGN